MTRVVRLAKAKAKSGSDKETAAKTRRTGPEAKTPRSGAKGESRAEAAAKSATDPMHLRIVEALLFAASEPLDSGTIAAALPPGTDLERLLAELQNVYEDRGVTLVSVAGKWQFRTAKDLGFLLHKEKFEERRLSRAAIETLAIISYHQPVTRADIEDIRGVMVSKGTIDTLMEVGWVRIRGRRKAPGRPVTYGTTEDFLVHFGLEEISDLPGMDELKAAGFLDAAPPSGMSVPSPSDMLAEDEEPYDGEEEEDLLAIPDNDDMQNGDEP